MFRIEPFHPADLPTLIAFVAAIQDHERTNVPELKPGADIAAAYADTLVRNVATRSGHIVVAKAGEQAIGFTCAWLDEDDDPLLQEGGRAHAYISDIFVAAGWRRKGVAQALLRAIEAEMRRRGGLRMRICSKAANLTALKCYEAAGYRPYEVVLRKSIE